MAGHKLYLDEADIAQTSQSSEDTQLKRGASSANVCYVSMYVTYSSTCSASRGTGEHLTEMDGYVATSRRDGWICRD